MMINKRLIRIVDNSRKYIVGNVLLQWTSLLANITMMWSITQLVAGLIKTPGSIDVRPMILIGAIAIIVRLICTLTATRLTYLSSKEVKKTLRSMIYEKLLRLGTSYQEKVQTSEIVQLSVEGVEQLESYFGAYLPQFFYAMLAPLTLFAIIAFINLPSAIVLLICVPLIPIAIAAVQTWAKKLLSKYWGKYTALGDSFLENLQGLTTLKIYQADGFKHEETNRASEEFRVITMKVLSMQLNSITIMDFIAYGGAALGLILSVSYFRSGQIDLASCLFIILLAADFFIPMRLLGSYFHIAMNGMAATNRIFKLLDIEESQTSKQAAPTNAALEIKQVSFSYEADREILDSVSLSFPREQFTAIVGESGSGKSTIAGILTGRNRAYQGNVTLGSVELSDIDEASLLREITYISHHSYLFKGTVRENLLMGRPDADDEMLWSVLRQVNLADFLLAEQGLETQVKEKASNLSGGQSQRLALARALLHDSPIYIFDEATSNIDVESEEAIMREIHQLATRKTVILISHRLLNVVDAATIYVMDQGRVSESGTHTELLNARGLYHQLWREQQTLEQFAQEVQV